MNLYTYFNVLRILPTLFTNLSIIIRNILTREIYKNNINVNINECPGSYKYRKRSEIEV